MIRAAALLGSVAHALDRAAGAVLRPIGLGALRGSFLIALLLAGLCGLLVSGTLRALEARPEPMPSTLTEVVGPRIPSGVWVTFPALVNLSPRVVTVPVYDSGVLVDEVERLHYLARDPAGGSDGVILRARLPLQRTFPARVEVDAGLTGELGRTVGGGPVGDRHLVDLSAPGESPAPDGEALGVEEVAGGADGAELVVTGRVLAVAADPGSASGSLQLLGEPGGASVVVRSPHPPDALPVAVTGTIVFDPTNVERVLAGWDLAEAAGAPEVDPRRLVATDFAPVYQEPTWLPVIAVGVLTAMILAGALVRYPVFRNTRRDVPAGPGMRSGETIRLRLFGTVASPRGEVRLDGERGRLDRMPAPEAARLRWRYWGGQVGDLRRDVEAAARGVHGDQLVVQSLGGGAFWHAEPRAAVEVTAGDLHLGRRVLPAVRLLGPGVRAILAFGSGDERDRSLVELRSALAGRSAA